MIIIIETHCVFYEVETGNVNRKLDKLQAAKRL
jgi:hypothetical protein